MVAVNENDTIAYHTCSSIKPFYLFIVFMKMTCPFMMCSLHIR